MPNELNAVSAPRGSCRRCRWRQIDGILLSGCANASSASRADGKHDGGVDDECPSTDTVVQSVVNTLSSVLHANRAALADVGGTVRGTLRSVGAVLAAQTSPVHRANTSSPTESGATAVVVSPSLTVQVATVDEASLPGLAIRMGGDQDPDVVPTELTLGNARDDGRRLQSARPSGSLVVVVATRWAHSQWLPNMNSQPRSPPSSPPPASPPREGCTGPSWLESGSALGSDVTSVELLGEQRIGRDLLPLALTTPASMPPVGGGNCTANVHCHSGSCTAFDGCHCAGPWRGPHCEVLVRCSVWEASSYAWRDCHLTEASGAVRCSCDAPGEIAVQLDSWEPSLTWLDFNSDWKLLGGLTASSSAMSLICGFLGAWLLAVLVASHRDRACLWSAEPPPPWTSSSLNFRDQVIKAHKVVMEGEKRHGPCTQLLLLMLAGMMPRSLPEALHETSLATVSPSVRSMVLAALREEHTVFRIFFVVPGLGASRTQWVTLLFNVLVIRLLATLIFFEHTQPSIVAEVLAMVISMLITWPSEIACRLAFDHAEKRGFWGRVAPDTRLRQLQAMHASSLSAFELRSRDTGPATKLTRQGSSDLSHLVRRGSSAVLRRGLSGRR